MPLMPIVSRAEGNQMTLEILSPENTLFKTTTIKWVGSFVKYYSKKINIINNGTPKAPIS